MKMSWNIFLCNNRYANIESVKFLNVCTNVLLYLLLEFDLVLEAKIKF